MAEVKQISFENYLKYFHSIISINNPDNTVDYPIKTPIFYKIEHDVLTISFAYSPYLIETKIMMSVLHTEYKTLFDPELNSDKQNPTDFMDWIQNKYLDNRGIEEL